LYVVGTSSWNDIGGDDDEEIAMTRSAPASTNGFGPGVTSLAPTPTEDEEYKGDKEDDH
jgi:hypothetical protein